MTVWTFLGTLLIGPLKLVFEIIYDYAYRFTSHPGTAIIFLSLVMNILILPLYRRADAMQEASRDIEAKLHDGVAHIKKTFSGDERMMILQTYYLQNHYKPTDALRGSVSLLLEIPFFIAAYQFLSNLSVLKGVSFGPIRDLGAPDGLLTLGGLTINLLPILMTLINVISSALYLKGFPLKTKIQLYAMALFFLVFLYSSPSCLLFYWTLNNLFSLGKNIFYRLKRSQKTFLPGLNLRPRFPFRNAGAKPVPDRKLFLLGSLFLTVLVGLFIPSVFIAASPQEFVDTSYFHHPLWYLAYSLCYAAGTFLIWMRVFYGLASNKGKVVFDRLVWILCGITLANYMFFGTKLGNLSAGLQYDNGLAFSLQQKLFNLMVVFVLSVILYLVICKWRQAVAFLLTVSVIALCGMSFKNTVVIRSSVAELSAHVGETTNIPRLHLSKEGKNVIVFMLDRAMGEYIPYLFNEKPELKEQFDGFTYYRNTVSFGPFTNFGVPALLGGYEYTPVEMNKRSSEPLVSKHNEALKMMPVLFLENGYDVTLCEPTYANYKWVPDFSIFDEYPEIHTYLTNGLFNDTETKESVVRNSNRNFFCFSIMKTMPLFVQGSVYENGKYHQVETGDKTFTFPQEMRGLSASSGIPDKFLGAYYPLVNLPNITDITDDEVNTYLYFANDTTHSPALLQKPDYVPKQTVDNTEYDSQLADDAYTLNGVQLRMRNKRQVTHYHANMAALLQLGRWFDYLRENDVYDNTRIILVSDHGRGIGQIKELIKQDENGKKIDLEWFYPLLMVKDFDSHTFETSDSFMTNADVPTLATKDLIKNPTNPFTGKPINSDEKYAHDQFIIRSRVWNVNKNNGNTFLPSKWISVKDNIWDIDNWTFYEKETVLDEYAAP